MIRRLAAHAVVGMAIAAATACPVAAVTAAAAAPAPLAPAADAVARLGLVSQQFDLDPAGILQADLTLPDAATGVDRATSTLVVTAYGRLTDRSGIDRALAGDLGRSADSVDLPLTAIAPTAAADLGVAVPIEATTRTAGALQLPKAGVYPIVFELMTDGVVVAELTTFVHRLPGADEPEERPLQVATVLATTTPVELDDNTDVVIDDTVTAELARLTSLLNSSAGLPVAVRVSPSVIAALAVAGPDGEALQAELAQALGENDLLSSPMLPLDPSQAADADQDSLYTQWLRDGEDALATIAAALPVRSVMLVDRPLSAQGGTLVRDLGARLVVLTPSVFAALPDTPGVFTDTTGLIDIGLADDNTLSATIVDSAIAHRIEEGASQPALTAVVIAAELLTVRQRIADLGDDPSRHGVTIGTSDLGLPDTATFAALAALLSDTDGLAPVPLDTLGLRTDTIVDGAGDPIVVALPDTAGEGLDERMRLTGTLADEAANTASMLADGAARPAEWTHLIGRLPSDALTDEQAERIAASLTAEFRAIRDAIQLPSGFAYTLTGRTSDVRMKIGNNSSEPLTVLVRLSSPKLLFPGGPQTVTLAPGELTEVTVTVEARSNGKFPVSLAVYTPEGGTQLGPTVPITLSVTALSGLGNLVTGALALVLLTWWVRHVRQNRRARATTQTANRHPVSGARPEPPALSPDAEASTLPDS